MRALALLTLGLLVAASSAAATPGGVVYLKGQQVWASKYDGSLKVQISSGDAWWNEAAVSTSGGIAGTKVEPGKGGQYSRFTIWNPDGTVKDEGPASPGTNFGGGILASPLGLELTPSNSALLFGLSFSSLGYPSTLTTGYAILPSATRVTFSSYRVDGTLRWPALVGGNRLIGGNSGSSIYVESSVGNMTGPFTEWSVPGLSLPTSLDYEEVQASDDGTIIGAQICDDATSPCTDKIAFAKTSGLLGTYVDDCFAPITGQSDGVDVSADGTRVVWADADGVKIAPTPNLRPSGPASCEFSSAPVTIEPGASHPAIGPVDVDAIYAARNPKTGTTTTPGGSQPTTPTIPTTTIPTLKTPSKGKAPNAAVQSGLTAAALAGSTGNVYVAVGAKGKITVTVTVSPKSIGKKGKKAVIVATGSATAKKAGQLTIKLKATKTGKALKKKLKGKKVTVKIKAGGKTTTKRVTLK